MQNAIPHITRSVSMIPDWVDILDLHGSLSFALKFIGPILFFTRIERSTRNEDLKSCLESLIRYYNLKDLVLYIFIVFNFPPNLFITYVCFYVVKTAIPHQFAWSTTFG